MSTRLTVYITGMFMLCSGLLSADTGQAMQRIADRLVQDQVKSGTNQGIWQSEADYTGSISAGMSAAYGRLGLEKYYDSAILAGDYIVLSANGNYFGDEAFSLDYLSRLDFEGQYWRDKVSAFYEAVRVSQGGTSGYISSFGTGTGSSTAVFYLSFHAVAAFAVDAQEKHLWRNGVIDHLRNVSDSTSNYPVLTLGVATWAISSTGPLSNDLVDPSGIGQPYWNAVRISDLPDILLSHQKMNDEGAGSFYYRFDHKDGSGNDGIDAYGYTEDAIFALMGLSAANKNEMSRNYRPAISSARKILIESIDRDGAVYGHLWQFSPSHYVYAGELLLALDAAVIPGDLNLDDRVDIDDLNVLSLNWLGENDNQALWNEGSDIDRSGEVNLFDFALLASNWQADER